MKVTLEDISPVQKKLLVEIDSQDVNKKLNEAYRELGKKAKVPGFRQGKIPRKILETHFRDQVVEDVGRNLITDTLPNSFKETEVFPLGMPLIEKESLKQGENFKYSALVEVRPHFSPKDYLGVEVEKEKCTVTEKDVQDRLDQILKSRGQLTPVDEDRPVRKDDYVELDYEGFEGERQLDNIKASNFLLQVGSNDFHPQFEEGLIGLKKGEKTQLEVDFEESYFHSMLAGKNVNFKVEIIDIKALVLPEPDDEFARSLDAEFRDLEGLKSKLREAVTAEKENTTDAEMKQSLMQKISDSLDFDLPKSLVESEIDRAVGTLKENLMRNGSNLEMIGIPEEKLRDDFRPGSEKRVKEMLILEKIAKQEGIAADEEDLAQGFMDLAATSNQDPQAIRKYYEARGIIDMFEQKVVEKKTLNHLVENAKIIETDNSLENQNIS